MDEEAHDIVGRLPSQTLRPSEVSEGHGGQRRSLGTRLGIVFILVLAVTTLLWRAGSGGRQVRTLQASSNVVAWELDAAYIACLTHQVSTLVPRGTPVWVSMVNPNGPLLSSPMIKVVAPYTPIVATRTGVVSLYLVNAQKSEGCLGVRMKAVGPDGSVRFGKGSLKSAGRLPGAL